MSADAVDRGARWQSEAAFFDAEAENRMSAIAPIHPRVLARYRTARRQSNAEEFRFRLLGNLAGQRVLDVGCGDGINGVLFAKLGASVTGIDISPKAIEAAQRRAEINGVADRCRFLCSPLETAVLEPGSFDAVWGDAILHHLIPELQAILPHVASAARPGGLVVFTEPINLDPALRALRFKVPVPIHATPDERPLERRELDILRRHLPGLQVTPFRLLGRLGRFVLPDCQYERAAWWRRASLDGLGLVD